MPDRIGRVERLQGPERRGQLPGVAGCEVPVTVIQPDPDGFSGQWRPDDDIEIVVAIDVSDADRDGILAGFERNALWRPAGDRELETERVTAGAPGDTVGNRDVRPAVLIEIADNRRPAERRRGISEPEQRLIRPIGLRDLPI